MPESTPLIARVILDSPLPQLDHPFDYAVPERLRADVAVGQRVQVPLRTGNRRANAWIIELSESSSFSGNLSEVESIVSPVRALPPRLYDLARQVADRQAGSAVDVLRLAIPARYVKAEKEYLAERDAGASPTPASRLGQAAREVLQATDAELKIVAFGHRVAVRVSGGVHEIVAGTWVPRWVCELVHQAVVATQRGQSSILVVPDFRDLNLLESAFTALGLGELLVRVDASLPGASRWRNYLRILTEDVVIVIGNRSSVYAPVNNLGLIALWDAADESFSEPLAPYGHPRDVALLRQSDSGCALIFAAHVPSVDIARLVGLSYLTQQNVGSDAGGIVVTDLMAQDESDRGASRIPPAALVAARAAIQTGPVLLQVARPGFAGGLRCNSCRERALCSSCHGPLALSSKASVPSCRWCGRLEPAWTCVTCHSTQAVPLLPGSEKTAEDLAKAFPGVLVHFSDGSKDLGVLPNTPALVIATPGTEPLVAGGYACVVILDGESARMREDIEADINALRIWFNAFALARGDAPRFVAGSGRALGEVIQTQALDTFARQALSERESLALPPSTKVAVCAGSREAIALVQAELPNIPHRTVLGPVPGAEGSSRLILTFDYRDGLTVAKALRALILKTALTSRKPAGSSGPPARVLRLSVRIDDQALRGLS
jgi:primosomal protein N' (replication factor Y)